MHILTDFSRSASPPPTYDGHGCRTNTCEVHYHKKLEDERIKLIDHTMKNDPNFCSPVEYHRQKCAECPSDKVYIPVKEFPDTNFFGLLVGPHASTLKMEQESGAKITIRGEGSANDADSEENLHCLAMVADNLQRRKCLIKQTSKEVSITK